MSRIIIYLLASFVSKIGDSLLLFGLPIGLGLELNDIRPAIMLWFVPGIAIFTSSFLAKRIESRQGSARRDYAVSLIVLAILEAIVIYLANVFKSPHATIIIAGSFIFFYAFLKEGLPRIFYGVAVYRFFCKDSEYNKYLGFDTSLNIFAGIIGAVLATQILTHFTWRETLIIDTVSFVILGLVILIFGQDIKNDSKPQIQTEEVRADFSDFYIKNKNLLRSIFFLTPFIFSVQALCWNYIPLIIKNLHLADAKLSIIAVAILRLPGIIIGAFFYRIFERLNRMLLLWVPVIIFVILNILFLISPNITFFAAATLIQGLVYGIYYPTELAIKNKLSVGEMISYNAAVVRKFSIFQILACSFAFIAYGFTDFQIPIVIGIILFGVAAYYTRLDRA